MIFCSISDIEGRAVVKPVRASRGVYLVAHITVGCGTVPLLSIEHWSTTVGAGPCRQPIFVRGSICHIVRRDHPHPRAGGLSAQLAALLGPGFDRTLPVV